MTRGGLRYTPHRPLPNAETLAAVGLLRFVGGRPQTSARLGVANPPRVPYPSLIPQGVQTAILAARPRKGDVRKNGCHRTALRLAVLMESLVVAFGRWVAPCQARTMTRLSGTVHVVTFLRRRVHPNLHSG